MIKKLGVFNYLVLLVVSMLVSPVTQASSVEVGQQVIYYKGHNGFKGEVVSLQHGGAEVDFGSPIYNKAYGHVEDLDSLIPYESVQRVAIRNFFSMNFFTLDIGEEVTYHDSTGTKKGKIVDLISEGLVKVDFGSASDNEIYGHYVDPRDFIRPL